MVELLPASVKSLSSNLTTPRKKICFNKLIKKIIWLSLKSKKDYEIQRTAYKILQVGIFIGKKHGKGVWFVLIILKARIPLGFFWQ